MDIGVPKEVKPHEYRVGLTPDGARQLVSAGHTVNVEFGAGISAGFDDTEYEHAGAQLYRDVRDVFFASQLIVKVKEPQIEECDFLTRDHILFTYLHLAAYQEQAKRLLDAHVTSLAYETVTDDVGALPLLIPMSEIAGRIAVQAAAHALERAQGGRGVLFSGVPGVPPAKVLVLGGGVVGLNAARIALGMGADVMILDVSETRVQEISDIFTGKVGAALSTPQSLEALLPKVDVVIGAVLVPGGSAPKLLTRKHLSVMQKGSVLVDVAIDQGGCFETSVPTTHSQPTYQVDGVVHYCVANMPGAVPLTSTLALTNATFPYVQQLATEGLKQSMSDRYFAAGLNTYQGNVTHPSVAKALNLDYKPVKDLGF